ncbi:hypothetical protein KR018_008152, partial [Drosophila ironensis]
DPVPLPLCGRLSGLILGLVYLLFVYKLGPMFMAHRKPYNVKRAMLIYNFLQIIMNLSIFVMAVYYLFWVRVYDFRCMTTLPLDHPMKNVERKMCFAYFLNKIFDLTDTVFFILRKSYKQISILHVYHHTLMAAAFPYVMHAFGPGGQYNSLGVLNVFVHAVMYAYYFMAALNPQMKNKQMWKKAITKLQMLQFLILWAQCILTPLLNPSCTVPMAQHIVQFACASSMFTMFSNFYYQSYIKVRSKTE